MASEWREVQFGDLCEISRGASPRPIHEWVAPYGIPWVKISDASGTGSRFIEKTNECIKPEARSRSISVFPGDLILSNSATPGIPKFLAIEACIHDGWLLLRKFRGLDKLFAYYMLLYERPALIEKGSGSVFTNLKTDILKQHKVCLPPFPEQRAIAHILGTLDDKIELNRRMNETLEQMALALFKAWFVDFEPVRAKCRGEHGGSPLKGQAQGPAPTAWQWPQHIIDLFPNRLVDSELGEIPEGWNVCTLGELMELAYGKALKEDNRRRGYIPVYGSNGQVGWHDEALAPGPGIVVGRKGNPGTVTWVPSDFFAIDTTFYVVPKERCQSFYFLFYALSDHDLPSLAADSAVPGLNRNFVYSNLQIVPPAAVLNSFNRVVKVFFERRYENERESRTLTALRDELLPKLISGEIRVKDAERFLKERGL